MKDWQVVVVGACISVILATIIKDISHGEFKHFDIFVVAMLGFYLMEFLQIKSCKAA